MDKLSISEKKFLKTLNSPKKIQDFLNTLGKRTDSNKHIIRSPRVILRERTANCIEGALIACVALMMQGEPPLIMDLKVGEKNNKDVDHVVALFSHNNHVGALSKTSHAVLRYREPIYKNVRELALSYFHEYFTDDGKKNLRSFSKPFDVVKKFGTDWITSEKDIWEIAIALNDSPHVEILSKSMERHLRLADPIEIEAGKLKDE